MSRGKPVVFYIFVIAVVNLALGFLLAAYLGHRYRALESATMEALRSLAEPPLGPAQPEPAAAAASSPPAQARAEEPVSRSLQVEEAASAAPPLEAVAV